jgi:hypothetical protein
MRDESGCFDLQRVHQLRDVVSLRFLFVSALRMRREPHASQIGDYHSMVLDQDRCHRRPHIAGIAKAVQHDHRWPLAPDANMDRRAVSVDVPTSETRGKYAHFPGD